MTHEKQARNRKNGTEVSTIRVKLSRKKWVQITNLYCRPASSDNEVIFDTSIIPTGPNSLIFGDFNAHTELWDTVAKADDRGEEVVEWALDNDLTILNDGDATRFDRHSNRETAPDITLCGSELVSKCSWSTAEPIGNSDHFPIITTVQIGVTHQTILGAVSRWRVKGVDWKKFQDETEKEFAQLKPAKSIKDRASAFVDILSNVATKVVGRTKPGKRTKPWLTPVVKAKIKLRNRLRRKIGDQRKEWKEACEDVTNSIKEATETSWRELLADVITEADDQKFWGIVKSLNGSPATNARNEAMKHNGKTITSDKRKADIFLSHYAAVSRLKFDKSERAVNRSLKKLLRKRPQGPIAQSCAAFSMFELDQAIQSMRGKGAAGPDDIPPAFLKSLGPCGKQELLNIFNQSLGSEMCPQIWRLAIIIPLLKAKKPASELGSYRPISLTSCIAKLLERMMANRIYHLAETNKWIHPSQAGFRKGRSCEDQITRVVQSIWDGFNASPMKRSVLVLLDFSKAYDTVWKQRLLLTLAERGLPMPLVRWLNSFLSNRLARVRFNGVTSSCRTMHQGLPQGSVLAPLLFILYINTLAEILPQQNLNSMFADDAGVLATNEDREAATRDAQKAVDVVSQWSREWKLNLNASKSEVSFFSTWTGESTWEPEIQIDGKKIDCVATPRLLGVTLDRQLTFGTHVENVTKAAISSNRMLSALAHSSYGWRKQCLTTVYHSMVKSKMDYAGPAWQGNICQTNLDKLERAQNKSLRLITGQFADTPLEALRAEAGVPSFKTHIERNLLKSKEKALRLEPTHPRRLAYEESNEKRTGLKNNTKHSWRSKSDDLSSDYHLDILSTSRKPLVYFSLAPWEDTIPAKVFASVPGLKGNSETEERSRELSYARIRAIDAEYVLYSDGSASAGVSEGGAGVVVTFGNPEDPVVIDTLTKRGSALTSSYNEESTAMDIALDWISEHCSPDTRVAIVTDSQSLCEALQGFGQDIKELRSKLTSIVADVTIQWVPGHSGIEGNELADAAAKLATTALEDPTPITYGSACAKIKATINDSLDGHERSAKVYASFSMQKESQVRNRSDQVLLGQFRAGHHWALESYHKLVDENHDTTCEECGWHLHDLEHWLCHCPATTHIRMRVFGTPTISLDILTAEPLAAVAFARAALSNRKSKPPDAPQQ